MEELGIGRPSTYASILQVLKDRGYVKLYIDHVNQADEGADLDILVGGSGTPLLRESH